MPADFLIGYDITQPRRLQRVHRYLSRKAMPIGYSVFFANGDVRSMLCMLGEARSLIDGSSDDLRCYPLPVRGLRARLGIATLPDGVYYSALPGHWMGDGRGYGPEAWHARNYRWWAYDGAGH